MEFCPNCSYKGKSLRKHLSKAPNCKRLFQQNEERHLAAATPKRFPPKEIEMPQNNFFCSSLDDNSPMISNRGIEQNDNYSDFAHLEDDSSDISSVAMPKVSSHGFTVDQYCETDLAKLLNDKHVPHGLYQDILQWACRAKRMKYSFEPKRTKRSTLILRLSSWQQNQNRHPFQKHITLPGEPALNIPVTCYDFKTELISLLQSSVFNHIENLDLNANNPFVAYKSPSGHINCFNAGKWYSRSYKRICTEERDFFLPIIFSYDESVLKNGNASIAPLKFTTSILNQSERNKGSNWQTLCLMPDLSAFESKAQRMNQTPQTKSRRLHALFHVGMDSYLKCEQDSSVLKDVMLMLTGVTKLRNIKIACGLVLGDIQGGDKICCRSASYLKTINRICRKCTIPSDQCDNLNYECHKISMKTIKQLVANKDGSRLSEINQYCVNSVW